MSPAPVAAGDLCRATGERLAWTTSCAGTRNTSASYDLIATCRGTGAIHFVVLAAGAQAASGEVPCGRMIRNSALPPGAGTPVQLEVESSGSVDEGWVVLTVSQ